MTHLGLIVLEVFIRHTVVKAPSTLVPTGWMLGTQIGRNHGDGSMRDLLPYCLAPGGGDFSLVDLFVEWFLSVLEQMVCCLHKLRPTETSFKTRTSLRPISLA